MPPRIIDIYAPKAPPGNALMAKEAAAQKREEAGLNPSVSPVQALENLLHGVTGGTKTVKIAGKVRPVSGGPVLGSAGLAKAAVAALLPGQVKGAHDAAVKIAHPSPENPPSLTRNVEGLLSGAFGLPAMAVRGERPVTPRVEKGVQTPETGGEAGQQIREGLRGAPQARAKQAKGYSEERSKRIAEAARLATETEDAIEGHRLAMRALKGDLPKIQYKGFEQFDETALADAFKEINSHVTLRPFEKVRARESLSRVLNNGKVPTKSEQLLLERVFGREMTVQLAKSATFWKQVRDAGLSVLNVPRALKSSFDLSAPFRQGLVLGARHPRMFARELGPMLKAFKSEGAYDDVMNDIAGRPSYPLMRESRLALTDLENIGSREEQFMSNLAEKIPIAGRGVRASGRAYVAFLNKFRADAFDHYLDLLAADGREQDPQALRAVADWVNAATGRGRLPGSLEAAAPALNAVFFSPRLIASRLQLLNPAYYATLDPFARRQALRGMAQLVGGISLTLWLAKLAGAEVVMDPRSADFGKIKIGDTRIDIAGGFQQYIVNAYRILKKEKVSSTTGEMVKLEGGYGKPSRADLAIEFVRGKEAPVPRFLDQWASNENQDFKPFHPVRELPRLVAPLGIEQTIDTARSEGLSPALAAFLLNSVGFGVQTYGTQPVKRRRGGGGLDIYSGGSGGSGVDIYAGK